MATTSGTGSPARIVRLALLDAATAGLAGMAIWALVAMRVNTRCSYGAIDGLRSFGLVSFSIAGSVGGHLLGQWIDATYRPGEPGRGEPAGSRNVPDPQRSHTQLLVLGAAVAFLALSTILLAYETLALVDVQRNWPITYYVRCFASSDPWLAAGARRVGGLFPPGPLGVVPGRRPE